MKILHVISSGGMYGAEAVILNMSRTLNRTGHTSTLGIFSNSANPNLQLHECALAEGIESHLISCRGQIDRTVPASIRALSASTSTDVLHAHGYKADVYAYLALRGSPTALVSTCHNWLDDNRIVRLYGFLDRRVLRNYQAVVAVSEEVRQRLAGSGVPAGNIRFIRNGIDLRPFDAAVPSLRDPSAPGALLVGWVGRLSREKGPDLFIQAAAKVHSEFPDAQFILVGEGPDRAELETLIEKLGLTARIHLAGRKSDMPAVYASFALMVSSSRREGLPMAILEGMASRLPWIATDVGDVSTIVQDDRTGVLVPSDNPARLADALATLLRHPETRTRLGGNARRLVETEFSAEQMTAEYLRVYKAARDATAPFDPVIAHSAPGETH